MRAFLDFEASSLADDSYPIEVGWVWEDGRTESHLLRPAPGWTDWDPAAEAIHGVSRSVLDSDGEPHDAVAHRVLEALGEHRAFASAPSWDGKWLSLLLRSAGLPRHALRLQDTDEAHKEAAAEVLHCLIRPEDMDNAASRLLEQARRNTERPPAHRALADAQAEREVWLEVRRPRRQTGSCASFKLTASVPDWNHATESANDRRTRLVQQRSCFNRRLFAELSWRSLPITAALPKTP